MQQSISGSRSSLAMVANPSQSDCATVCAGSWLLRCDSKRSPLLTATPRSDTVGDCPSSRHRRDIPLHNTKLHVSTPPLLARTAVRCRETDTCRVRFWPQWVKHATHPRRWFCISMAIQFARIRHEAGPSPRARRWVRRREDSERLSRAESHLLPLGLALSSGGA